MILTFGEKLSDYEYKERYGCYAVIFDRWKERIAVIVTASGNYFLPGKHIF